MVDERLPEKIAAQLAAAGAALSAGQWEEARDGFQATLEIEDSGTAAFGLAIALWWLHDPVTSIRLQERAFGMFQRDGDHENAFFAAMYLCLGYDMTFGNLSASRGWLAKAARVVRDSGLGGLRGWLLLCEAVTLHHQDLVAAEEKARTALDAARETNDVDLNVCARSELGTALVELGRTDEGTALLDEAMAAALGGEVQTLDSLVLASCRTITACSRVADVKRAIRWIRAATRFADAAAAMLREWGVKAVRRGPNAIGSLTAREHEILGTGRPRTTLGIWSSLRVLPPATCSRGLWLARHSMTW